MERPAGRPIDACCLRLACFSSECRAAHTAEPFCTLSSQKVLTAEVPPMCAAAEASVACASRLRAGGCTGQWGQFIRNHARVARKNGSRVGILHV